jgi:hypothetical protein
VAAGLNGHGLPVARLAENGFWVGGQQLAVCVFGDVLGGRRGLPARRAVSKTGGLS